MTKEEIINLAVEDIFTTGQHEKAIRLKMVFSEREGGTGWGKQAIADKLRNVFDAGVRAERERIMSDLNRLSQPDYPKDVCRRLKVYIDELREAK